MQALYQWDMSGTSVKEVEAHFIESQEMSKVDMAYFSELLHGIPAKLDTIDENLGSCLDRSIEELDPIERATCRIGAYEMLFRMDIPVRVVINESIEITKKFGADQGHKFVNGVMDKLAQSARKLEINARKKSQ